MPRKSRAREWRAGYQAPPMLDGSEYTADEVEFMFAMHDYLTRVGRYPVWDCRDVLAVAHALGYRKVEQAEPADVVFKVLGATP